MSIRVMAGKLITTLGMEEYKKPIKSAACILDENYGVELNRLYRACKVSGVSEEVAQYVLLSKGMEEGISISDDDILDNVRYAYPVLMLCSVYYELHEKLGKTKDESISIIEHQYVEIPITYVTVFKSIV